MCKTGADTGRTVWGNCAPQTTVAPRWMAPLWCKWAPFWCLSK